MSVDVFCRAMDNDISTQVKRSLEVGTGIGVLNDEQVIKTVCNLRNSANIEQSQQGIGRCLQPDQLRAGTNSTLVLSNIACCEITGFDIIASHDTLENAI